MFYVYTYICIILYVYMYIYIIVRGSYTRKKCDYGIRTNGQWQKIKCPARNFIRQTQKRKAPAFLQGLERSALYTIASSGCIVAKRREQCYNLRGVLLSRFGYNIARVSADSYKAGAFRHFWQHREWPWPARGPVAPSILSSFAVKYNHLRALLVIE